MHCNDNNHGGDDVCDPLNDKINLLVDAISQNLLEEMGGGGGVFYGVLKGETGFLLVVAVVTSYNFC